MLMYYAKICFHFAPDEFSPAGMVLRRPGVVQVRVMVTESTNPNGMKMLAIQEEIVEVAGDEVEQINVKEILLEFTRSAQEDRRSITIIKLTKSKIHKHARKDDKHLWAHKGMYLSLLKSDVENK